jgi:hypothetical protein
LPRISAAADWRLPASHMPLTNCPSTSTCLHCLYRFCSVSKCTQSLQLVFTVFTGKCLEHIFAILW